MALAQQQGAGPAGAVPRVAGQNRSDVLLESVPAPDSRAYQELRSAAGDGLETRKLELTGGEVWSVASDQAVHLQAVASRLGIASYALEPHMGHVMAPMAPDSAVSSSAQSMMKQAMRSQATMGASMMATMSSSLVEHALTRNRDAAAQSTTIVIALPGGKSVSAVRRNLQIRNRRVIWHGVIEGTENPVSILWSPSGRLTGSINTGERIYQLRHLDEGVIGVIETMPSMLPDEHPALSPKRMEEMRMREDTTFTQGDASAARRGRPDRRELDTLRDDSAAGSVRPVRIEVGSSKPSGALQDIVIDVLVAYTSRAAAFYSDIRRDLIELAIEDANESFRASGLAGLSLRLVHTHQTDYDETGGEHFDHVWRMVDRDDGYLEEIPRLRNEVKADIAILIVDDASGCGLATRVAADHDEAFAVVHQECAATSYSIAHEIGHLLGARHDRSLDRSSSPFAFGHGYVSPDLKWRTMMSYKAGCKGCPRLPIWSSPDVHVDGRPAGDAETDNARVIRLRAEQVSRFR